MNCSLRFFLKVLKFCAVLLLAALVFGTPAGAQTFQINQAAPSPAAPAKKGRAPKRGTSKGASKKAAPSSENPGQIGFGSNIELARLARAAQKALDHHRYAEAQQLAQRAINAAPGDSRLWFLLGYTSRLTGNYKASFDAYQHGLKLAPNSPDGLSGLAQTYDKSGNKTEALRILNQVIAAHPDRIEDMLIAGELYIQSNQLPQGLQLLQRAEAKKPSSHSELLMAIAYMRLKQPAKAAVASNNAAIKSI